MMIPMWSSSQGQLAGVWLDLFLDDKFNNSSQSLSLQNVFCWFEGIIFAPSNILSTKGFDLTSMLRSEGHVPGHASVATPLGGTSSGSRAPIAIN